MVSYKKAKKSYSYVKNLKILFIALPQYIITITIAWGGLPVEKERGLLIVLPSRVTLDRMYNIYLLKCTCIQNDIELRKSILYPKGVLLQQQPSGHFSSKIHKIFNNIVEKCVSAFQWRTLTYTMKFIYVVTIVQ